MQALFALWSNIDHVLLCSGNPRRRRRQRRPRRMLRIDEGSRSARRGRHEEGRVGLENSDTVERGGEDAVGGERRRLGIAHGGERERLQPQRAEGASGLDHAERPGGGRVGDEPHPGPIRAQARGQRDGDAHVDVARVETRRLARRPIKKNDSAAAARRDERLCGAAAPSGRRLDRSVGDGGETGRAGGQQAVEARHGAGRHENAPAARGGEECGCRGGVGEGADGGDYEVEAGGEDRRAVLSHRAVTRALEDDGWLPGEQLVDRIGQEEAIGALGGCSCDMCGPNQNADQSFQAAARLQDLDDFVCDSACNLNFSQVLSCLDFTMSS